jgi:hypothetical protein
MMKTKAPSKPIRVTPEFFTVPICEKCNALIRLVGIETHPHNRRFELGTYECAACGHLQTGLVPRDKSQEEDLREKIVMPTPTDSLNPVESAPLLSPVCLVCGLMMRLARITPHDTKDGSEIRAFECESGHEILQTINL